MSDFIDVFTIGDGEDTIIEICKILEETKGQPRKERIKKLCENPANGRWSKEVGGYVDKRIAQLKLDIEDLRGFLQQETQAKEYLKKERDNYGK